MSDLEALVHSTEAVLILGSLNANPKDRNKKRSEVRPVQLVIDGTIEPASCFDSWGDLGIGSLAFHPQQRSTLYVTTGSDLYKVDLLTHRITHLDVPNLRDVHEITVIDNVLWLASTGNDKLIALDLDQELVTKIVALDVYRSKIYINDSNEATDQDTEVVDRFHCNLVFEGLEGDLYALVHHVKGKQLSRRIEGRFLKSHGDGGVINLSTGQAVSLHLRAPHNAPKVGGSYWILDSGRSTVKVYDRSWNLEDELSTKGWGRGAGVSPLLDFFYVGISATRKRYLGLVEGVQQTDNLVQVFSIESRQSIGEIEVPNVEQINNIYVIPKEIAIALLELSSWSKVQLVSIDDGRRGKT